MCSITLGRWPWAIEHIKLFPAARGKCSGLLTSQTLYKCVIYEYIFSNEIKTIYNQSIFLIMPHSDTTDKATKLTIPWLSYIWQIKLQKTGRGTDQVGGFLIPPRFGRGWGLNGRPWGDGEFSAGHAPLINPEGAVSHFNGNTCSYITHFRSHRHCSWLHSICPPSETRLFHY